MTHTKDTEKSVDMEQTKIVAESLERDCAGMTTDFASVRNKIDGEHAEALKGDGEAYLD